MEKITIKAVTTTYGNSEDWEFIGKVTAYSFKKDINGKKAYDCNIYVKNFESIGIRLMAEALIDFKPKYMVNRISEPIKKGTLILNAKIDDELYIYIDAFDE